MSDTEREHWDRRYLVAGARSMEPATFLREVAPQISAGSRVLDVGGGSGRNALWLATRGHRVTIADISESGLAIAVVAAHRADVKVATVCLDLDKDPLPDGPWDVIIDFHFMKRDLFPRFLEALRPGGFLVICQATVRNLERHDRPPRPYLLDEGEGWHLLEAFELLIAREGWSAEDRHEFEALARVPTDGRRCDAGVP